MATASYVDPSAQFQQCEYGRAMYRCSVDCSAPAARNICLDCLSARQHDVRLQMAAQSLQLKVSNEKPRRGVAVPDYIVEAEERPLKILQSYALALLEKRSEKLKHLDNFEADTDISKILYSEPGSAEDNTLWA